ncbi:MAG: glycosyltransferase family 1 protein [Alphaproteobacteria bacterium]|nr:glycosyltransferase family 1 protein [Alphaproteobacteria bacterium]
MSKILLCVSNAIYHNNTYQLVDLYDQIVTELARCGNEVLVYIPNLFQRYWFQSENPLKEDLDEEKLRNDISAFNPDLVITFNNAIYNKLLEVVNCNIAVWDADLEVFWNQKGYIEQNLDRYFFFCFSEAKMKYPKKRFGCSDDRIFNIRLATSFKASDIEKKANISFIGTNFGSPVNICNVIKQFSGTKDVKNFLKAVREEPEISSADLIKKINPSEEFQDCLKEIPEFYSTFAKEDRLLALSAVADLGLDLYGDDGWYELSNFLPSLTSCKKKKCVFSAKENEDIYNGSKICLNIIHPQTVNSFPFRVPEVMATSACLVSSYSPAIEKYFKGVNIPFFEHPADARVVCKKLLDNENMRLDIVAAGNEIIDKDWRWEYRFREIEQITGVSLFSDTKGSYTILQPAFKEIKKETKPKEKEETIDDMHGLRKFKYKLLYKIWKKIGKKLARKGMI